MSKEKTYLCIDLKSFYASVECAERGLDPLDTMLVVADESRTDKTICLAVSPSLKRIGLPGRPRLFEVVQKAEAWNQQRLRLAPGGCFAGESCFYHELEDHPETKLRYIVARPRMSLYMDTSTRVFNIYRRFVSEEDIHVYSIDEVFIDLTPYLSIYGLSPRDLAMKLIREVLSETGITATAGLGTNLYLAKIAMDILAKKMQADEYGVRIAFLDEMSYRQKLWAHEPLTDFWRIGGGIARRLHRLGLHTMGDIARCSLGGSDQKWNEELLYKQFGVNAELLVDHAWGYEPAAIADIKAYIPQSRSISMGQVLPCPYPFEKARLIVREMADQLALSLVDKGFLTDQLSLYINYDSENLRDGENIQEIDTDYYGRNVPKAAHGSVNLSSSTSSSAIIIDAFSGLFDQIVRRKFSVRRINLCAAHLGTKVIHHEAPKQLSLFEEDHSVQEQKQADFLDKEKKRQLAILQIRDRYGKNAILRGMNLEEGATGRERNGQVGGHRA